MADPNCGGAGGIEQGIEPGLGQEVLIEMRAALSSAGARSSPADVSVPSVCHQQELTRL